MLPLSYCNDTTGQRSWRWKALPEPRPLYGLDRLVSRPDAPVLIVEGEKAADAAQAIFPDHVVTTSSGGSRAARKTDWTPLQGRELTLWPDNDATGAVYAQDAGSLATEAGVLAVAIAQVPDAFPEGWDLADDPPNGWDAEALRRLLKNAKPFRSSPDMSVLRQNRRRPPEFPLDAFGPFWSGWLKSAAEGAGAPVDYTACALLATASALIGNARWVKPWEGWCEPPVLWIGLVGNPGDGKSPGVDPVLDLLRTLEDEIAGDFESVLRKYEEHKEAARAARTQWEEEVKKAVKNKTLPPLLPETAVEPEAPIRPRLHISDLTPEALGCVTSAPVGQIEVFA